MYKRVITRPRGFFTFAQNGDVDYLRIAYAQALSLRATQKEVPWLAAGVTPGTEVPDHYREVIDEIIEIPWGDCAEDSDWKLENEWKAYHITPYEETIKLDCDMLFLEDVSHWWKLLHGRSINICSEVRTYHNQKVTSDFYRTDYTGNNLPNTYSAAFYFQLDETAKILFDKFRDIYQHWELYSRICLPKNRPEKFTTDTGLALAVKLLWFDEFCLSPNVLTFTHMKSQLQKWKNAGTRDFPWTCFVPYYFNDDLELLIGNVKQTGVFHFHIKDFLTDDIILKYERYLGL